MAKNPSSTTDLASNQQSDDDFVSTDSIRDAVAQQGRKGDNPDAQKRTISDKQLPARVKREH